MSDQPTCACGQAPKLIFACAGASDTAEITFRAAKRLTKSGIGKMYCLAGIGGRVPDILASTAEAERILAIDGCELDCARLTLERAGFQGVKHLRVTDLGLRKGSSPANLATITLVAEAAAVLLSSTTSETSGVQV